jgi:Xaa-Pro aminopeptidase
MGGEIYVAAERELARSSQRACTDFLAHGMGLVSHEAPRLTATGPIPYDDPDARKPLEPGMVVSIETTMKHPRRKAAEAGTSAPVHRRSEAVRPQGAATR